MKKVLWFLVTPLALLAAPPQGSPPQQAPTGQQMDQLLSQIKEQQKQLHQLGQRVSKLESVQQWFVPPPIAPAKPSKPGPPSNFKPGPPSSYINNSPP